MTGIVIVVVAAIVTVAAALVLALSMSDRVRRRPDRPSDRSAENLGSFGLDKEKYAGPPGYGRPAGYGPPPLWTEARRDPP